MGKLGAFTMSKTGRGRGRPSAKGAPKPLIVPKAGALQLKAAPAGSSEPREAPVIQLAVIQWTRVAHKAIEEIALQLGGGTVQWLAARYVEGTPEALQNALRLILGFIHHRWTAAAPGERGFFGYLGVGLDVEPGLVCRNELAELPAPPVLVRNLALFPWSPAPPVGNQILTFQVEFNESDGLTGVLAFLAQIATFPGPAFQQVQECFTHIVSQECASCLAEVRLFLRAYAIFVSSAHVQNAPAADAAVRAPSDIASQLMHVLLSNVHLAMHHTAIDIEEDPTCFDDLRSALFACLNLLPRAGDEAETQAATPSNFQVCGADAPVADAEDISHDSSASHRRRRMHAAFCG
eukprot:s675_g10.t1